MKACIGSRIKARNGPQSRLRSKVIIDFGLKQVQLPN